MRRTRHGKLLNKPWVVFPNPVQDPDYHAGCCFDGPGLAQLAWPWSLSLFNPALGTKLLMAT
jgi:hypothetical protein